MAKNIKDTINETLYYVRPLLILAGVSVSFLTILNSNSKLKFEQRAAEAHAPRIVQFYAENFDKSTETELLGSSILLIGLGALIKTRKPSEPTL